MKRCFTLFVFITMLSLQMAFSQYQDAKDAISARGVFLNYQFPINNDWSNSDFTSGAEIEYVRHLNNALNLAFPLKIARAELPTNENGGFNDASIFSLDALLQLKYFREKHFIYPYLFAGIGAINEDFDNFTFAAPVGLGLNFRLGKHAYLSTKGEYRFGFDDLRSNIQVGAGLLILLGEGATAPVVTDADKDGIPDAQDLCPQVAGLPAFNGCPDTDNDGITDSEDDCPTVAGTKAMRGCPDSDGDGVADKDDDCPNEAGTAANKGCPIRDADNDGVPDSEDECPNVSGKPSLKGCPDRDNDGIADKNDKCPDEAGTAATGGCPDKDGDGVIDKTDRCPNSPGPASNNGCPELKQEEKETLTFAMRAVQFETAKSTLLSASFEVLNQIVDILKRYPDYKMRINGHTDSIGSSTTNQSLSEKRAKTCYDYLISKGIDAARLSYTGYGESRPVADNKYKDGRDKNRRVEFDIYLPD